MKSILNTVLVFCLPCALWAQDSASQSQENELTRAYQREILFLSSYKKELKTKLASVQSKLSKKILDGEKSLKKLESQWLSLQTSNEMLIQKHSEIEADFDNKNENRELLEATIKQAQIERKIIMTGSQKSSIDKLGLIFSDAMEQLYQSSHVVESDGVFYLKNGEQVQGRIIQVGGFSRFAFLDQKIASLYPSGGGNFKVWSWLPSTAAPLALGQLPEVLSFFLYDNPEKEFIANKEKSIFDTIQAGGLIGWVIVLMGLFALLISGLRFILLYKAKVRNEADLNSVLFAVGNGEFEKAHHNLLKQNNAISRVLRQTLSFLVNEPAKIEDAIQESILKESQIIDRFGVVILVIASVAPLMGLLGTVTGMISTFDIITLYGTGNPKLLSGGISEALITTMLGLLVAIPALLIGQYLSSQNERVKSDMEKWALALCNSYKNKV